MKLFFLTLFLLFVFSIFTSSYLTGSSNGLKLIEDKLSMKPTETPETQLEVRWEPFEFCMPITGECIKSERPVFSRGNINDYTDGGKEKNNDLSKIFEPDSKCDSTGPSCVSKPIDPTDPTCQLVTNPNCNASTIPPNPYRNSLDPEGKDDPGLRVISTYGRNFADTSVINLLKEVGKIYSQKYPGSPRIAIGDMTPEYGKTHKTHNGKAVDFKPMTTDGNIRPIGPDGKRGTLTMNSPNYDQALTREVIGLLIDTGKVRQILFNDPVIIAAYPGIVKSQPGHHDHFHVDFK
jgi:hypothetical protein